MDKINKNKKGLTKTLVNAKKRRKEICIREKFYALGVTANFSVNISNKLIDTIANFFI